MKHWVQKKNVTENEIQNQDDLDMFDGYLIGALTETGNKLLMKKNSGKHVRKQCKWFSKSLVDMKRDLLTLSKKTKFGKS